MSCSAIVTVAHAFASIGNHLRSERAILHIAEGSCLEQRPVRIPWCERVIHHLSVSVTHTFFGRQGREQSTCLLTPSTCRLISGRWHISFYGLRLLFYERAVLAKQATAAFRDLMRPWKICARRRMQSRRLGKFFSYVFLYSPWAWWFFWKFRVLFQLPKLGKQTSVQR